MWALQDALELRPERQVRLQLARGLIAARLPRLALTFLSRSPSPSDPSGSPKPELEEWRVAAAAYLAMADPWGALGVLNAAGPARESSAAALFELGNTQEALGDDLAAAGAYQRHLQQDPDSVEGYLALGRVATRLKRGREALAALERARELSPDDPRPLYLSALALQARGGSIESAVEKRGSHPGSETRESARAVDLLRRVLQAHPDYGPAHLQLGLWYQRLPRGSRRPAEALAHLEAARAAGGEGDEARLRLAEALDEMGQKATACYHRGVYYLETQQPHRALREFQRMARLEPAQPRGVVMVSTAYVRMDEAGQAAEAARRGLERFPDDAQLLSLHAKALALADKRGAATEVCRRWLERSPNAAEPYYLLASMEREALRFDEAARLAEQALARDADNAEYLLEAVRIHAAMGTPEHLRRATEKLERAIHLRPDDPRFSLQLADLLRKLGHRDGALQEYQCGLDRDPGARHGVLGLLQLCPQLGKSGRAAFYGEIVRALQERSDATEPLWRRVRRDERDGEAHARLAQRLFEAGDLRQARFALQQAVALRPKNRDLARQLAIVERLLAMREG
jgi:tetratricopeptide (TPR) repeat protein